MTRLPHDLHRRRAPGCRYRADQMLHLTRFIRHESSAIFAVPGGAAPGEYVGQHLLEG
jgi:hypothetical protein